LLRALKKTLHCDGHKAKDKGGSEVVCVTGDQREKVKDFLVKYKIADKEDIVVHGF
jgi:translation initiation factor 1 (eIF-1/SUI1)